MDGARKVQPQAEDKWMSLVQAAAALGIARQTLLKRAAHGEITADLVAGRTVILRADVERMLNQINTPASAAGNSAVSGSVEPSSASRDDDHVTDLTGSTGRRAS